MLNRNALLLVAGAAFFALDATAASAQDSTTTRARSQRRIPVSKESHGEVVAPRVDTVTVFRTDTLRMAPRVDTVTVTNTVTRVDTVVQTVPVYNRPVGGFYFGLAGGTNLPSGGLRSVNNVGGIGQAAIGWRNLNSYFGVQLDGQYTQFSKAAPYVALGGNPHVWNANLDARLDVPFVQHIFGKNTWFTPYIIGGGSWVHYSDLRMKLEELNTATTTGEDIHPVIADNSWHSDWGWNAGGGLAWHLGRQEFYVESRVIQFNRGTSDNGLNFESARQIPIMFGVNFF